MTEYIKKVETYTTYHHSLCAAQPKVLPKVIEEWMQNNHKAHFLELDTYLCDNSDFDLCFYKKRGREGRISVTRGDVVVLGSRSRKPKVYTPEEFKEKFEVSPYE